MLEGIKDLFKPYDENGVRQWNKTTIVFALLSGFFGWLVITATVGVKLKRLIKRVPLLGSVFKR